MLQPPAHATNRAVTQQSSQPRALLLLLVLIHPSHPQLITRASASASASGGSTRMHAWHCPECNQCVAVLSSAAARMQKKLPFGTRVILQPAQRSPTQPPVYIVLLPDPQTQQWQSSVIQRVKEAGTLTGARYRPGFGFLSLTQPAELLVIILGTGRRGLSPGSLVPPKSARRTESGWGQSGCSQPGDGGMAVVHFPALSYSALLRSTLCLRAWGHQGQLVSYQLPVTSHCSWNAFPSFHLGPGAIMFRLGETWQ